MIVISSDFTLPVSGSPMRVLVTAPAAPGRYPGIIMYSDIFQISGAQLRVSRRLAGYGFVVATPEIFHRREAPGTAIAFDDDGRTRGMSNARSTKVAEYDADARATLDFLAQHEHVRPGQLGAMGFCIGGHLGFRAALQPDVRASALFYPTGVHDGKLGEDADAGSLARARDITGELLLVFGTRDPHVPVEGRAVIDRALRAAGTRFSTKLYDAEHAFARDEGPRHDPEATDDAWRESVALFRRVLA